MSNFKRKTLCLVKAKESILVILYKLPQGLNHCKMSAAFHQILVMKNRSCSTRVTRRNCVLVYCR
ncbi:unnamed protein product [Moneuplotes crassus]|uniref:Uncharacterized protein n=1 Tax=Euplotes crassus TaxID=5936 RepID=A0AAD1XTG7_EUPCR|nr:unnamed protein product [Moneuplotes crassus]